MKTTLLFNLLAFCLLQFSAFSQNLSAFEIYSENGEKFTLSIDGKQINDTPASNVRATDLRGDFFRIQVQFDDESLGMVSQGFAIDPGMEQKAVVMMKNNGKLAIRPSGQPMAYNPVSEQTEPRPSKPTYESRPEPQTQTETTVQTTTTHSTGKTGEEVSMDIDMMGTKVGVSVKVDDGMDGEYTTTTTETTRVQETETVSASPEVVELACPEMASGEYNELLNSIKSKTFSDSKMSVLQQVFKDNCMSAEQIKNVMSTFTYEEDKLEFAKMAYDHCTDPKNYWKLNDAFEFEMTIEELNEFLESK
jgi:hypothetical protein